MLIRQSLFLRSPVSASIVPTTTTRLSSTLTHSLVPTSLAAASVNTYRYKPLDQMSRAIELLDRIIKKVEGMPTAFITHTPDDLAWGPQVPKGHSEYTWAGGDDAFDYNPIGNRSDKPAAPVAASKPQHQSQPPQEKKQPEQSPQQQQPKPNKQPKQQQQQQQPQKSPQQKPSAPSESNAAAPADGEKKEKGKKENKKENKKTEAAPAVAAAAAANNAPNNFSRFVFKVGRVVKAEKHPGAEKMYVEQIDLGEENPRTICSGLVGLVPLEELATADVVVVANLKPVTLRGIESNGMVLAASNATHDKAALVKPPVGSKPGERVYLEGASEEERKYPGDDVIDLKKKDGPWNEVSQGLKTDDKGVVCFNGKHLITSAGALTADGMPNAIVK